MKILGTLALLAITFPCLSLAQTRLDSQHMFPSGEAAYEKLCARCHTGREDAVGPNLKTGDYDADIIRFFVRHGSGPMPAFTESTINDDLMANIAAYLAEEAQKGEKQ
ncbi:MAG: cytochrome c [Pseudodonghicola sp.]